MGSFRYNEGDYKLAVQLASSGRLPVNKLITRKVKFEDAEQAFHDVHAGKGIKLLIAGPSQPMSGGSGGGAGAGRGPLAHRGASGDRGREHSSSPSRQGRGQGQDQNRSTSGPRRPGAGPGADRADFESPPRGKRGEWLANTASPDRRQ